MLHDCAPCPKRRTKEHSVCISAMHCSYHQVPGTLFGHADLWHHSDSDLQGSWLEKHLRVSFTRDIYIKLLECHPLIICPELFSWKKENNSTQWYRHNLDYMNTSYCILKYEHLYCVLFNSFNFCWTVVSLFYSVISLLFVFVKPVKAYIW